VVAAKGHTITLLPEVAPTCTETGLTSGVHCSVCQVVFVKQEEIVATGHVYESVYTAPTFEADGFTTYTCKAGDHSYTVQDEGSMLIAVVRINDTLYASLDEALKAAAAAGVPTQVTLMQDIAQNVVVINSGVTLNLAEYTLTASNVLCMSGSAIIGNGYKAELGENNAQLITPKDGLNTNPLADGDGAAMLPVWNKDLGSYVFANFSIDTESGDFLGAFGCNYNQETGDLQVRFKVKTDAASCFDAAGGSGIRTVIRVSWDEGDTTKYQDSVYNEKMCYLAMNNYTMTMKTNVEGRSNYTVTIMLITDSGMVLSAPTFQITPA
jgi:hypothetical protein